MKRFYVEVATAPAAGGFAVLLDGKPVRTPARHTLAVPAEVLAEAIAAEWREQVETIAASTMRLTRLATTVVDLMPARRADAVAETTGFAGTDLLCYRAISPASLVSRQIATWQPWLDWAERQFDARLTVAHGVMPVSQSEAALRALRVPVERLDDWRLVGLHGAVTLLGSLVLGLALEQRALGAEDALAVALLDELFEVEQWGQDAEQARRHARLRTDLAAIERYLALVAG